MLDNLTIECPYQRPENAFRDGDSGCIEVEEVVFKPRFSDNKRIACYEGKWANLYIKLFRNKIVIANSIHKLLKKGINHDDFYLWEIIKSFDLIAQRFKIKDIGAARVKKLEFAININYHDPKQIYSSLISHNDKGFVQMIDSKGFVYGAICHHEDYKLKCYDKSHEMATRLKKSERREVESSEKILRFEMVVTDMDCLQHRKNAINIHTVGDLLNVDNLLSLLDDLLRQIKSIDTKFKPAGAFTDTRSYTAYRRVCDFDDKESFKKISPRVLKEDMLLFKKMNEEPPDIMSEILGAIYNKGEDLIYGRPDEVTQAAELTENAADKVNFEYA